MHNIDPLAYKQNIFYLSMLIYNHKKKGIYNLRQRFWLEIQRFINSKHAACTIKDCNEFRKLSIQGKI